MAQQGSGREGGREHWKEGDAAERWRVRWDSRCGKESFRIMRERRLGEIVDGRGKEKMWEW